MVSSISRVHEDEPRTAWITVVGIVVVLLAAGYPPIFAWAVNRSSISSLDTDVLTAGQWIMAGVPFALAMSVVIAGGHDAVLSLGFLASAVWYVITARRIRRLEDSPQPGE